MRLVFLLLIASPMVAQPAEPWKWTLEQRLAARFDPAMRAARVAEVEARDAKMKPNRASASAMGLQAPGDVIDGNLHPELFLPTELFERFIRMVYVTDWRPMIQPHATDVLRTDADWDALAERVAAYGANLAEDQELYLEQTRSARPRRIEIDKRLAELRAARCSLEKDAFRAVRQHFGAERFDRFLYVVVSRGIASVYAATDPVAETRARLTRNEEACQ
jgi:hypothetical protein